MFANKHVRRALGVLFLAILLAEWASHSIIDSHDKAADAPSISAHGGHGDLCNTMVCSDRGSRDQRNSNLGREPSQHAPAIGLFAALSSRFIYRRDARIDTKAGDAVFRPPDRPFHPPEIS